MSNSKKESPKPGPEKTPATGSTFVFGKQNYLWMIGAVGVIVLGFALMSGGRVEDPSEFNPEIFNTRRIVIAPMVVLAGFALGVYAIFKTHKD